MARPNWEYIRVDVLLPTHPKLAGASPAVLGVLVAIWCYCGQYLTDGFVAEEQWRKFGTVAMRHQLVQRGFAAPVDGGYQMHDYLGHQRSRAEAVELSAKRRAAGSRGGRAKADAVANTVASAKQMPGGLLPLAAASKRSKTLAERVVAEAEAEAEAEADLAVAEVDHQSSGSNLAAPQDDLIDVIINEIHTATGTAVTPDWAAKIAADVLAGRQPADPAAYARQAIRSEPAPRKRFLPNPGYDGPAQPARPPWCGECDERTRMAGPPDEPYRCLACHPLIRRADRAGHKSRATGADITTVKARPA